MKIRLFCMMFVFSVFIFSGCTLLIPEHATKTKEEFYADKSECDKEAWLYEQSLHINDSDSAQISRTIDHTRRCLKKKGWYYIKKSK